jgi:hypothetical protein
LSGTDAALRQFVGECCFQVIYFVSSIFFLTPIEMAAKRRVETGWLRRAVKNAWAKPELPGFAEDLRAPGRGDGR